MMLPLHFGGQNGSSSRALAIGAHPDDIEIGCAGTLLKLIESSAVSEILWVVLSGEGERAEEARRSAEALLDGVPKSEVTICDFPDGFFPYEGKKVKDFFEDLKRKSAGCRLHASARRPPPGPPGRLRADLEHLSRPPDPRVRGAEVRRRHERAQRVRPLSERLSQRKIAHLMDHFVSQRSKHWFQEDLFSSLLRLRGMECNSPSAHAEAFFCRKAVLA